MSEYEWRWKALVLTGKLQQSKQMLRPWVSALNHANTKDAKYVTKILLWCEILGPVTLAIKKKVEDPQKLGMSACFPVILWRMVFGWLWDQDLIFQCPTDVSWMNYENPGAKRIWLTNFLLGFMRVSLEVSGACFLYTDSDLALPRNQTVFMLSLFWLFFQLWKPWLLRKMHSLDNRPTQLLNLQHKEYRGCYLGAQQLTSQEVLMWHLSILCFLAPASFPLVPPTYQICWPWGLKHPPFIVVPI